jgi:PAS domain S-box-containing protein
MEYKLNEILDVALVQELQDRLNRINPFPSGLLDLDGNILTATAWQDLCSKFHRVHPDCKRECQISDRYIQDHLDQANPAVSYRCPRGLVDNAIPIIVEGKHLGNFISGQFFLEPPDLDFYREQARIFGFDEDAYLEAVKMVPVWSAEQVPPYLEFAKTFIESIAQMGLARIREEEARRKTEESETRFRRIVEDTEAGYFFFDREGIIRDVNAGWARLYKYESPEEFVGHHFMEIQRFEDAGKAEHLVRRIMAGDPSFMTGEFSRRCKDDSTGYHTFSAHPVVRNGEVIGIEGFIIDITRQKEAEMERDVSRTRLASVFEKMVEGFALHEIICDENGTPVDYRFLEMNPAFEKLTGLHASEIIGKTALATIPGLEYHWVERYGQVALTGEPVTFEMFAGPMGRHYRVVAFSNRMGEFATIFEDITEQLESENEIRESENKYRQLADLMPSGLLIHVDGVITYANRMAARIFATEDPAGLIGRRMLDFLHPEFRDTVKERIRLLTEEREPAVMLEEKLVRANGEVFFAEVSAVPFQVDGQPAVQVVFNDITERRMAEERVRTLAHAIDSIHECVSMTDTENNILFVNRSFCQTYGYSREELIGKNISMMREDPDNSEVTTQILEESIKGGWSGELINRRKDGSLFPVFLSTALVPGSHNAPLALIGVAVDITERKKNEADLIAAKEKAEESDRLKSAFLANISHEIRTPLNSILGFSELLEEMVVDPIQQEYLRVIARGGDRLLNIINSVIDIAKIEAGQEVVQNSRFDIKALLQDLYELNRRRNRNILFVNDAEEAGSFYVESDKTKLFQILNNLLSNALKYTQEGSVRFGFTGKPGFILFYVKDTGVGIPEEFRERIFQRFQKADLENRSDFEGTGLGLAITRELVHLLGGRIWFESETGKGSVFHVELPLQ